LKNVFQSRDEEAGELVEMSEAEAEVEAWRQREGVKNDDGVVEGVLPLDNDGRDGEVWRALDDVCRFSAKVGETRSPGANVELEALDADSSMWTEVLIVLTDICFNPWEQILGKFGLQAPRLDIS
jgi:hypothetical protein